MDAREHEEIGNGEKRPAVLFVDDMRKVLRLALDRITLESIDVSHCLPEVS